MVRINGKEYAWGNIKIILWGRTVIGATGIDYKPKKAKKAVEAQGTDPRGIQHGSRSGSGTLTVLQSEIIAFNRAAREKGYRDLLDVDVDILISYIPDNGSAITIDRIVGASFEEIPMGMKTGDFNSEHALPFIALGVDYDITSK